MKSKQEVIQEAWGEHWPLVDGLIDENGWYSYFSFMSKDMKRKYHQFGDLEMQEAETLPLIRPKSLSGIENNNGWTRIESVDDLPRKENTLWLKYEDGSIVLGYYCIFSHQFKTAHGKIFDDDKPTHYQPIIKPEAPIY